MTPGLTKLVRSPPSETSFRASTCKDHFFDTPSIMNNIKSGLDYIIALPSTPLRIGAAVWEPAAYNCSLYTLLPTVWCPHPGIDAEILGFILEFMNIQYQLIPYPLDVDWGIHLGNGNWSGLIGEVINGSLDTISASYIASLQRMPYISFSYPIRSSEAAFIVRKEHLGIANSASLVFKSFSMTIWAVIFSLFLGTCVAVTIFQKLRHDAYQGGPWQQANNNIWTLFGFFFCQSTHDLRKIFVSGPFILLVFSVLSFYFCTLYQSSLLSQLLADPGGTPFSNIMDMISFIKQTHYKLVTQELEVAFFSRIETDNNSIYPALRDAVEHNPVLLQRNQSLLLDLMEQGGGMIMQSDNIQKLMILQHRCSLESFEDPGLGGDWLGFIFQKESPWLPVFQHAIISLDGYIRYITDKYTKHLAPHCNPASIHEQPLSMYNLSGLLAVSILGLGIAVVGFFVEVIIRRIGKWGETDA